MDPTADPAARRSPGRTIRTAADGEGGWIMIEVVWSAMVIGIVIAAVLTGMDTAAISSGLSRARATSATLAEQDQERLRAMRAVDLSNYRETRTVNLGGGPYTVTSLVEWLRDSNGEPLSCTNGSSQADYLLIGSTVSSGAMRGETIHVESLLAPPVGSFGPTQGSFGVQVVDRASAPVQDVLVAIAGPRIAALPTNELGCAIFGYIPAGSYTATLTRLGWVDVSGKTIVTKSGTVTGGNVNAVTVQYDRAAELDVTFDTVVGGVAQPSSAQAISVANSGVPPSGVREFTSLVRTPSFSTSTLFPFASGYVVYAGTCAAANPQTHDVQPTSVQTEPGSSDDVVVRVPAINVAVTRGGAPLLAARVKLTPTASGCSEATTLLTNAQGALVDPGMPFGSYTVCADDGLRRRALSASVQNTDPAGTPTVSISIPTSGTLGVC